MTSIRSEHFYFRDPASTTVGTGGTFLFSSATTCTVVPTAQPAALSHLLERLGAPTAGSELLDGPATGLEQELESLIGAGIVLEAPSAEPLVEARGEVFRTNRSYSFEPGPVRCPRLVLAMTGSVIAGLMAPFVLSLAYSRFHEKLELIITPGARSFVQPELFEYYGIRTWTDPFARRDEVVGPHITLAKSADLVVVMPATARSISRLAAGECSDLLSLVVAATSAPVVVAPTMNTAMWDNPSVRRNVDQLRADGSYVMEPTLFFEAAELINRAEPGVGMAGAFWSGPSGLMKVLGEVLDLHHGRLAPTPTTPAVAQV